MISTLLSKLGLLVMSGLLAFPGAEGYGANTVGGRGGEVVRVTNLNDSGQGSLRWALENVSGPRIVVFEVNGTITLKKQILIDDPYVTIAGQTAGGEGITIEGSRIRVKADEVIIRGLHFRPGDGAVGMDPSDRDGLFIGTTDFQIDNVIIDHNSFSWAIDENFTINGNVHNLTASNNIIAQALSKSIHPEGEHSKGMLISNWASLQSDYNAYITITKNLFAGNMARNPEVRAGQNIEIVNNYMYNYGSSDHVVAVGGGSNGTLVTTVKIVGNVFQPGPSSSSKGPPIAFSSMAPGSQMYLADNLWMKMATDALGNQAQSQLYWGGGKVYVTDVNTGMSNVLVLDSQQVRDWVLANAGASPGARDTVDARIINEMLTGGGKLVNTPAEAGGLGANPPVAAAVDTDKDGMPDWFEERYGLNPLVKDNNGDQDADGYTNIEEYINGLITGFDEGVAKVTVSTPAISWIGGPSDDVITGGATQDYIRGAEGNDRLYGAGAFDDINGNIGNDTAAGGDGDDWVVGGKDNDVLTGDAGADIVYGNLGADTADGGVGNDIVRGGQDNDSISGGAGLDWMSGDKGADTVSGGAGADIFHTFQDAGIDRVLDFNRAEGDRVQLDPGTVYSVGQVGADTVIDMGGGNQMILVGVSMSSLTSGWIFGA